MAKRIGKKLISATSTQKIDGKLQPQALELEEAVLGALMIDKTYNNSYSPHHSPVLTLYYVGY